MKDTIVGLDLSLTSSGVAIIIDGKLETRRIKPEGYNSREKLDSLYQKFIELWTELGHIDTIVIEEPIIGKYPDTAIKIISVHGVLQASLGNVKSRTPMFWVHPMTLKKVVTGHGKGDKDKKLMKAAMFKKTGIILQHDEADAAALAYIGKAVQAFSNKDDIKLSKMKNTPLMDDVLKEFGFSLAIMNDMEKAKAKEYREKYREKQKVCSRKYREKKRLEKEAISVSTKN